MPQQAIPAESDYGDALFTVKEFSERYNHLYPTTTRLRWLLRDRVSNGLINTGAAVEVFANGREKPSLYIHAPSWFRWMRSGGSQSTTSP